MVLEAPSLSDADFESQLAKLLGYCVEPVAARGFNAAEIAGATVDLPPVLQRAYARAGRSRLLNGHNRLLAPSGLESGKDGFVVFGEENQSVVLWGYRAGDARGDPYVYQRKRYADGRLSKRWGEEGQRLSEFLISFGYWNLANGAAMMSCVGEAGDSTLREIAALPLVWRARDFEVRGGASCAIGIESGDFYVFGNDEKDVRATIRVLRPAWSDLESSRPA